MHEPTCVTQLDSRYLKSDFTPLQQRILLLLSDGHPHHRSEILKCLKDPDAKYHSLHTQMYYLRKKMLEFGQYIVCEYISASFYYRHVVLLKPIKASEVWQ